MDALEFIINFAAKSDEEIIDAYLGIESKILCMALLSTDEQNYFDALFQEITRRDINGKVDERRNNPNM
jgi:hypothetical protein